MATVTAQPGPAASTTPPRPSHPPVQVSADGGNGAAPPDPAANTPGLPSPIACLEAGRAFSDCVFHRDQGGPFAPELDATFGAFLTALGSNWKVLSTLEDLDVWMETADNVLDGLAEGEQQVRHWYEVGYQLATMLNLAAEGADAEAEALREVWQGSWEALSEAALEVGFRGDAIQALRASLDNLIGPEEERDYTNVGRVQERVRQQAADA